MNSNSGSGAIDSLTNADGSTLTLTPVASPFGEAIVHIPSGVGLDTNYVAAHNLNFFAGANSDGLGAYAPSFALTESGQILIATNNPATSGNNTYQIVAEDGFYLSKDGSLPALIKTDLLTAGHTYQFPDSDGTIATTAHLAALTQDNIADGTTYKQYSDTEKTKLSGIATGATANSSDATLLARANHTGTQSADTLTDGTTNKAFLATERTKLAAITGTNTGDQIISDATISTTDITTNNASTSKHGFLKKLSNVATEYMDGTGAWSTPAGSGDIFTPADQALLAWSYNPVIAANSTVLPTAGLVNVVKMHIPVATSITNIILQIVVAGSTLTAGQCFAALYQSGTLLGTTADQATAWTSTGTKTMAISGGAKAVVVGDVYVAFYFNGTTGPAFARSANTSAINTGLAAASSRFGTADTGRTTTMPPTLGTISSLAVSYWAALS